MCSSILHYEGLIEAEHGLLLTVDTGLSDVKRFASKDRFRDSRALNISCRVKCGTTTGKELDFFH